MDDGYRNVKVICDDTNVFLLLLYYYQKLNWQNVLLATIDESRKLISIKGTAEKQNINFLAASNPYIITMQYLTKDVWHWKSYCSKDKHKESSSFLGNLQSMTSDVTQEAKQFAARCYGVRNCK